MKISDLPQKQAEHYIQALQEFQPHRQLLVKVGGGLLEDKAAVQELAEALTELARRDLHTIVVHGGGPQLSAALKQYNVEPRFIEGKRYTDEATLKLAKATFEGLSDELFRVFGDAGIKTAAIPAIELFEASQDPKLGLVGTEITSIHTETIMDAMKMHSVLVVNSLARNEADGTALNVNADTIFRALATEMKPHRMVSLTPTGGVLQSIDDTETQSLISGIDIRDVDTLIEDRTVTGGMALKLRELANILNELEIGSAISITKPSELLLELLTDEGSGTFVGKGQKIITAHSIAEVLENLSSVIQDVFGKSLPEGYEEQAVKRVYYTKDLLAFGIVTSLADGTPYLDKLAVSPQLQGRGIGQNLWYRITGDYPAIVWRSHVNNRYATWYHRHADIMKRSGEWILFGRGVDFARLEILEEELVNIPAMR
jgi:acetylglutamate kinase